MVGKTGNSKTRLRDLVFLIWHLSKTYDKPRQIQAQSSSEDHVSVSSEFILFLRNYKFPDFQITIDFIFSNFNAQIDDGMLPADDGIMSWHWHDMAS